MSSSRLLNIPELSQMIRLTPGTIRVWVCQKKIPYVKMGKKVLFDCEEIDQWIEDKKISPKEV
jgi:excisionase family DNA binding protein